MNVQYTREKFGKWLGGGEEQTENVAYVSMEGREDVDSACSMTPKIHINARL